MRLPVAQSGNGATLAMAGAFVLAGELQRAAGDAAVALPRYEALLKPYVAEKQKLAGQFAGSFLPSCCAGRMKRERERRMRVSARIAYWVRRSLRTTK
jgi:2-polyprenyl-6-methoxyphenol hydroxylase-like FAD-dependent oxidoreductase